MQVNLHGSPCIPGVFHYCFNQKEKQNLAPEPTKMRHFDPKISKNFGGKGHSPSPDHSPCGERIPLLTPHLFRRLDSARAEDFGPQL